MQRLFFSNFQIENMLLTLNSKAQTDCFFTCFSCIFMKKSKEQDVAAITAEMVRCWFLQTLGNQTKKVQRESRPENQVSYGLRRVLQVLFSVFLRPVLRRGFRLDAAWNSLRLSICASMQSCPRPLEAVLSTSLLSFHSDMHRHTPYTQACPGLKHLQVQQPSMAMSSSQ